MPKKYRALFIFTGNIKDESLEKIIEQNVAEIEKLGGTIESSESLGRLTFARTMKKQKNGTYVKCHFSIEPEKVEKIYSRFRQKDDCFRLQIVKRNERIETAKKADNERRALFQASLDGAKEAAASEATANEATANETVVAETPHKAAIND